MGPTVLLHRGADEGQEVDPTEMELLISSGLLIRVGQRSAVFSAEGVQLAATLEREERREVDVDPAWDAMRPVLEAAWREWVAAGAQRAGVSSAKLARTLGDDRRRVDEQLALLEQGGWVDLSFTGSADDEGGISYAPSAAAMQLLGGWPQPDSTLTQQFMAAVAEAGESSEDGEERTRLQEFRDAAGRVGESTLAAILAKLATGGVPHI
jgi:hypothetical protein